ncbi:branched-chain amino acid ABC transporter permease [Bosea sp. AS-1]|uniref:branched-chain amino acid ABC transporter permease n=1 Tax=Bosea sp. AS-1 TaxID=2015316 RepID=UPI000B76F242|nr:branched-chain amino acid ABC transporter permease [Bosea sp. AS-1]
MLNRLTLPLLFMLVLAWALAPLLLSRHLVDLLVFAGLFTIGGLGVGLLLGQCGIVNLAQAVFYGIGAYSSAYLTTQLGLPSLAGFVAGMAASAAIAIAVGWPILRLTGFFLALATLALSLIGNVLFFEWDWLTGGTLGIGGIPKLSLFGFAFDTPERVYYLVWPIAFLVLALADNLVRGRPGLAMRAMRDAAPAAEVLGVDMHSLKTAMFVICAMLGSLAGSLFAHYVSYISVQSFTVERSIAFLLIPVVAGSTSIWGTILGALFVTFVPELLSGFGDIHQVLFGLALVLVVTLLPDGLTGGTQRLAMLLKRRMA